MFEPFVILLTVIIVAIAFFCFVLWAIAMVARLIWLALWGGTKLTWRIATGAEPPHPTFTNATPAPRRFTSRCHNDKCRAPLPASARFCVRCGASTSAGAKRVA